MHQDKPKEIKNLILGRREGESVILNVHGELIRIKHIGNSGSLTRLCFYANENVKIDREEIFISRLESKDEN